jgi:hypothetical protein
MCQATARARSIFATGALVAGCGAAQLASFVRGNPLLAPADSDG